MARTPVQLNCIVSAAVNRADSACGSGSDSLSAQQTIYDSGIILIYIYILLSYHLRRLILGIPTLDARMALALGVLQLRET